MPAQPRVGAMIRRARQRLRMSQQDLALKVGVARSAVNAWERDRAWPRNIVAVEEALSITLDREPAGPEPVPWNVPLDQWEADTLAHPDLDDETKRELIVASRAARDAYAARREGRPGGRQAG